MYANVTVFDDNGKQISSSRILPMVTLTQDIDKSVEEYSFQYSIYRIFRKNDLSGNMQPPVIIDDIDLCDQEVNNNG